MIESLCTLSLHGNKMKKYKCLYQKPKNDDVLTL